jgi:hypothetical protein
MPPMAWRITDVDDLRNEHDALTDGAFSVNASGTVAQLHENASTTQFVRPSMMPLDPSRRQFLAGSAGWLACVGADRLGAATKETQFGLTGAVGPQGTPRVPLAVGKRWDITDTGIYENYLLDLGFADHDALRIRADRTTLRHCELRNGLKDAIEVYADDVRIESCRIHHFLAGTFKEQADAHGITGCGSRLTIHNCEISHCSGDAWQMDPGRGQWSDVVIDHCDFWTGPLSQDRGGFKAGQQPGENGVDTKQSLDNPRSMVTIRNTVFHGYAASGYIDLPAALNLKDHVQVLVENCVFYGNHVALRLRGPGPRGGAQVTVRDCYFYDCAVAIRLEDKLDQLEIINPRIGAGVQRRYQQVGGQPPGARIEGEQAAPRLESLLNRT